MLSFVKFTIFLVCFADTQHSFAYVERNLKLNPVILISMDGFRAGKLDEFLKQNPNSSFQKQFVEQGVKSAYVKPGYPSNTFPNHYSIITG